MELSKGLSRTALTGLTEFATYYGCKTVIEALALADYIAYSRMQSLETYLSSIVGRVPESIIL